MFSRLNLSLWPLLILLPFLGVSPAFAQCSPFAGIGNVQFLDNTAKPLTAGVVYFYQAGTSTQQSTFTSSTCGTVNTNPLSLAVGGRAQIWLTSSSLYKVVLCAQNDGPACSAGDIIFSVDQVPGGSSGGGGSGSPFIGVFISGSSNPASSGAIRLASGDLACFRNAANSGNLCISKDSNDLLSWAGGSLKLPEGNTPTPIVGFDILEADVNSHRVEQCPNGGACTQIVDAGVDINTSDQVTQFHFGTTAVPLGSAAPTTGQVLLYNGTNAVFAQSPAESTITFPTVGPITSATCITTPNNGDCVETVFAQAHVLVRFTYQLITAPAGCGTNGVLGVRDVTAGSSIFTTTVTGSSGTFIDSGAISVAMPAGHTFFIGPTTASSGCGTSPQVAYPTMVYQ